MKPPSTEHESRASIPGVANSCSGALSTSNAPSDYLAYFGSNAVFQV
jgi:hypothetical protein